MLERDEGKESWDEDEDDEDPDEDEMKGTSALFYEVRNHGATTIFFCTHKLQQ